MNAMPIFPIMMLLAACAPVEWPDPPGERDSVTAVLFAAASFLIPVISTLLLCHHFAKCLYEFPAYHRRYGRQYARGRRFVNALQVTVGVVAVVWGWGWFVQHRCLVTINGITALAPFAELLVPMPFLTGVWATWLIQFDAMKAFHFAEASPVPPGPFWTRWGFFLHRFRRFAFLVLMPVIVFAAYQSVQRFYPEEVRTPLVQVGICGLFVLLYLTYPLPAIPILGLKRISNGKDRERLERVAKRLVFRCGGLMLWPTHNTSANAMVMGLLPRIRFVIFTDLLLSRFDDEEIEAVLGHEIGHVRHHHMLFYAAFLLLSMLVIVGFVAGIVEKAGWFPANEAAPTWLAFPPLVLFGVYLFFMFGLVSRKCERQADLYGVQTVADGRTEGHPLAAGVNAMTRALEKVQALNRGDRVRTLPTTFLARTQSRLRDWTHGSIADRIAFLQRMFYEPELAARFQRQITLFRWLILVALGFAVVALGQWLGWRTLAGLL
ncbi:hypothetical protein BH11PLA2_BH11PLA2_26200 [soil metagenome]